MNALLVLEDLAVPDQDRFERGFAPGWGKVYRLAKGASPLRQRLLMPVFRLWHTAFASQEAVEASRTS
jgi:hypothetical protein